MKITALQRTTKVANDPVERDIKRAVDDIWESAQRPLTHRRRGRPRRIGRQPWLPTQQEKIREKAKEIASEKRAELTTSM